MFFRNIPIDPAIAIRSSDKKVYSAAFLGILRGEEDSEASLQSIRTVLHPSYWLFEVQAAFRNGDPKALPSLHRSSVRPFNLLPSFAQHTHKTQKGH